MSLLINQVKNKTSAPPLEALSELDISGKTVLVTGASGGLGLEAARHYVRLGAARVVLAVRSQEKGDTARKEIESSLLAPELRGTSAEKLLKNKTGTKTLIDVWTVDMASFESVKALAARATQELESLDIALLNAAVSKDDYEPTKDGWDETIQVNVLSTVLLALHLIPKLRQSSASHASWTSRLSIVIARAHEFVQLGAGWQKAPNSLKALNRPDSLGGTAERYVVSKFLLVMADKRNRRAREDRWQALGPCHLLLSWSVPVRPGSQLEEEHAEECSIVRY